MTMSKKIINGDDFLAVFDKFDKPKTHTKSKPKKIEEPIIWDEHQEKAITACFNSEPIVFITGDGGTGKSAIIKHIVNEYKIRGNEVILLAPTNSAGKNIGGITLHKYFEIKPSENIEATKEEDFIVFDSFGFEDEVSNTDKVVIVDEVSMIGRSLMAKTINKIEPNKLILLGDLNQLPPPKDRTVKWGDYADGQVYKLKVNYRANNKIVTGQIDYFKKTNKYRDDIEEFSKAKYKAGVKILAFKNATLSKLQRDILGYETAKPNDLVILGGAIYDDGCKIYDNGDTVQIRRSENFYNLDSDGLLEVFSIDTGSIETKYPIRVICGDYKIYNDLKDKRFKEFKKVMELLQKKYRIKTNKGVWSKYKQNQLEPIEHSDLKEAYKTYMFLKNTPYARHADFITTYKAQGKGYDTIAICIDDFPNKHHSYVAISRAMNKIYKITKGIK